jgi:hypothetical protein
MKMRKIKPLSEQEFRKEAQKAFHSVFKSDDPYDEPFIPSVSRRAILYPIGYLLEPIEMEAVVKAARAVGDNAFYFSVFVKNPEAEKDWQYQPFHFFIPMEDLDAYYSLGFPYEALENVIYSPNGLWGMTLSDEQHAVVGGPELFMETLFAHLPSLEDKHIQEFLDLWKYNRDRLGANIGWLPQLLRHVYGPAKARKLMEEAGLEVK